MTQSEVTHTPVRQHAATHVPETIQLEEEAEEEESPGDVVYQWAVIRLNCQGIYSPSLKQGHFPSRRDGLGEIMLRSHTVTTPDFTYSTLLSHPTEHN